MVQELKIEITGRKGDYSIDDEIIFADELGYNHLPAKEMLYNDVYFKTKKYIDQYSGKNYELMIIAAWNISGRLYRKGYLLGTLINPHIQRSVDNLWNTVNHTVEKAMYIDPDKLIDEIYELLIKEYDITNAINKIREYKGKKERIERSQPL